MLLSTLLRASEINDLPIIAHWSFDEDAGHKLSDSGPNKLNAKLISKNKDAAVTTAKGMKGKALELKADQKFKYVIEDKSGILNLKPPYSICSWVKRTGKKPSSMCIFCKKHDNQSTGYGLRISWFMVNFRIGNSKHKNINILSPSRGIKNDTWYHVAAVNDGKTVKILVNGEVVKTRIVPKDVSGEMVSASNKTKAVIGNYVGRNDAYNFVGLIDELYIFGKALSKEEIFRVASLGM
jgi:hypothetical protein